MNVFDLLSGGGEGGARQHGRIYGVVIGIVTNNQDKDRLGRVKLRFPWLDDDNESDWARVAAPMAGGGRGVFFLPEIDDEVLVAFQHGDPRFPYVIGALWNRSDAPPETNGNGKNDVRVIRSRSGHMIRLTDSVGGEKIEIVDKTGSNAITIDSVANKITIKATEIEISASATVTVKGGVVNIN